MLRIMDRKFHRSMTHPSIPSLLHACPHTEGRSWDSCAGLPSGAKACALERGAGGVLNNVLRNMSYYI